MWNSIRFFVVVFYIVSFCHGEKFCPDGFIQLFSSCYGFFSHKTDYYAAKANCNKLNTHLARIENDKEWNNLQKYIKTMGTTKETTHYWIEGIDLSRNNTYIWQSNNQIDNYHLKRIPKESLPKDVASYGPHCSYIWNNVEGMNMAKARCPAKKAYICEKKLLKQKSIQPIIGNYIVYYECPAPFERIGHNCYHFPINEYVKIFFAIEYCASYGAKLIFIENKTELEYLREYITKYLHEFSYGYWIAHREDTFYSVTVLHDFHTYNEQIFNILVPRERKECTLIGFDALGDTYEFRGCNDVEDKHRFICKTPIQPIQNCFCLQLVSEIQENRPCICEYVDMAVEADIQFVESKTNNEKVVVQSVNLDIRLSSD